MHSRLPHRQTRNGICLMFNYVGPAKPLEEVSSRTLETGRFYKIDDQWMPSITTVVGNQSKHGILQWQKRVGFA